MSSIIRVITQYHDSMAQCPQDRNRRGRGPTAEQPSSAPWRGRDKSMCTERNKSTNEKKT